jgi:hypothetical protein
MHGPQKRGSPTSSPERPGCLNEHQTTKRSHLESIGNNSNDGCWDIFHIGTFQARLESCYRALQNAHNAEKVSNVYNPPNLRTCLMLNVHGPMKNAT